MPQSTSIFASIALLALFWKFGGTCLRHYFTDKTTILYDLPKLGKARQDQTRISGTAVIVGGSMAGLWAARVCADHFEDVLIIEPEAWTCDENGSEAIYDENGDSKEGVVELPRQRVMQYTSSHGYQPIQLRALRRLFPEFDEEVRKADGRVLPHEHNISGYGGHILRLPSQEYENEKESNGMFMTRECYERLLRRLNRKSCTRIRWLTGTATEIKAGRDSTVVHSVIVRTGTETEREIPAALVVDCSGPAQIGLKWLTRLYNASAVPAKRGSIPFEDLKIGYKTLRRYRVFRIYVPPDTRPLLPIPGGYDNAGVIFCFYPSAGKDVCKLIVHRAEGHRVEIVFVGWTGPPIPSSIHEIKDYWLHINALEPFPNWIFDVLDMLIKAGGHVEYTDVVFPPFIPSNFIAIGDSVMRANPAFGQGCSKVAMGAVTLDSILRTRQYGSSNKIAPGFGYAFFKKQHGRIANMWYGTKAIDYLLATTIPVKGETLSEGYFSAIYRAILTQLSVKDDQLNTTLWKVGCLLAPPVDIFHPVIVAKVTFFWVKEKLGIVQ